MSNPVFILSLTLLIGSTLSAQNSNSLSKVWIADQGDGTYKNPILHADYSDPDVVRVGEDFFMTASSFNCIPGLPILHSKDIVNWSLIGYALKRQPPFNVFDKPQHGKGVWAPCIRYHNNEFYIYYPDPDYGIYLVRTKDPFGEWSEPVLVKEGKGLIDPTPLWDEDGKTYLAYAFAGSRAGIKSILVVSSMTPDGTKLMNDEVIVLDGHDDQPTVEGPKFYKRNGFYYIFAPAGGVATGWQLVLRSKSVFGPYEKKVVMDQGSTKVNGPHQGAWVNTSTGEDWFIHFQDKGPYGRVVHLQPLRWVNDWPVIGVDKDGDGKGEPVLKYQKPKVKTTPIKSSPPESDEFELSRLGLQWQWHANPQVYWGLPTSSGHFKMFCRPLPEGSKNFWDVPNLLLQKFPAPEFTVTTRITFNLRADGERAGLIVMGRDYSYLSLTRRDGKLFIYQAVCKNADKGEVESTGEFFQVNNNIIYLRVKFADGATCQFSFSEDGKKFKPIGKSFNAREGGWIGAKVGLFAVRENVTNDAGSMDVDWFRITP